MSRDVAAAVESRPALLARARFFKPGRSMLDELMQRFSVRASSHRCSATTGKRIIGKDSTNAD
jgi:hypothetical protein